MNRTTLCLGVLTLLSQVAFSQREIIHQNVTVNNIAVSSRGTYTARTNIALNEILINSSDSGSFILGSSNGGVNTIEFSPDEHMIAFGTYEGFIELWDLNTQKLLFTKKLQAGQVNDVAFSIDSRFVYACGREGLIKQIGAIDGKVLNVLTAKESITTMVPHPKYQSILLTGDHRGNVSVWDLVSKTMISQVSAHSRIVLDLIFDNGGSRWFSCSLDGTIGVWDFETMRQVSSLSGHIKGVLKIDYDGKTNSLVSGGMDNSIRVWNLDTFQRIGVFAGHKDYVVAVKFHGDKIMSGSRDKTFRVWDSATVK